VLLLPLGGCQIEMKQEMGERKGYTVNAINAFFCRFYFLSRKRRNKLTKYGRKTKKTVSGNYYFVFFVVFIKAVILKTDP